MWVALNHQRAGTFGGGCGISIAPQQLLILCALGRILLDAGLVSVETVRHLQHRAARQRHLVVNQELDRPPERAAAGRGVDVRVDACVATPPGQLSQ